VRNRVRNLLPWLTLVAVVLAVAVLVPPLATAARHDVFAEAIQFEVLAVIVPALVVLGAPWRPRGAGDQSGWRPATRLAAGRSGRSGSARGWLVMIAFIVVALAWRLPQLVNAVVRHPVLLAAEAVTLILAGCALWLELVDSPPLVTTVARPQRALMAAVPMWAIWASTYVMAFSHTAFFSALAHAGGHGISTSADQQIAAALLVVVTGLCFVPVVYVSLITWLRDNAKSDEDLRDVAAARSEADGPMPPRPPRGWRLPSA
jgi:cytochrome c oxidase assembly factor CtaG